jgi:ATP-dependent protease ClpP protease subunit
MVASLTPEILALRQKSNDPITVFIDSPGGSIPAQKTLIRLLKYPDQLGQRPWVNTFVLGEASSTAAELLSQGDYAIAYPDVAINFHGARTSSYDPYEITAEKAKAIQYGLLNEDWISTTVLANVVFDRLLEIYFQEKDAITQIRQETSEELKKFENLYFEGCLDVPAFARFLSNQVNYPLNKMIQECLNRMAEYDEIALLSTDEQFKQDMERTKLFEQISRSTAIKNKEGLKEQLTVLNALLMRRFLTREQWNLNDEDFLELGSDFTYVTNSLIGFLKDYPFSKILDYADKFIPRDAWKFMKSKTEENLDQDPALRDKFEEVCRPAIDSIDPLWGFAEMLCKELHRGEYELSPHDAWWLGLVDEVIGTDLSRKTK